MKVTIEIDCKGAAFADSPTLEMLEILSDVSHGLKRDGLSMGTVMSLRDSNGNRVGRLITEED